MSHSSPRRTSCHVDDDEALCSSLVDLMHSIGYRATPFRSAENFLTSPERFAVDCIIADIHMPGLLDGIQVAQRMCTRFPAVPVLYTTGRPDVLEHVKSKGP